MNLPKITTASYSITLPFTKNMVQIRPYLVAEEKALMMAKESNNLTDMLLTLKSVLNTCTHGTVDIEKLPTCDLDYLFVQLRVKSRGSIQAMRKNCNQCQKTIHFDIDLSKVETTPAPPKGNEKIMLTDNIGLIMKYPGWESFAYSLSKAELKTKDYFTYVTHCISYVFEGDKVFSEFSTEEIEEWLGTLTESQFQKIADFFRTIPRLFLDEDIECPECHAKEKIHIEGIHNFLA